MQTGLGSSQFARRYYGNRSLFLFLRVLRCFTSPGYPPAYTGYLRITAGGLPHSDIHGSKVACTSPWLFAAYHVLHRSPVPRHPSRALSSLTYKSIPPTTLRYQQPIRISHTYSLFTALYCQRSFLCGANRARTDNLRLARAALSQLSYSPISYSLLFLWAWVDLNHRPHAYQACALTT